MRTIGGIIRRFNKVVIYILAGFIGFVGLFAIGFHSGASDVMVFCEAIKPGLPISGLPALAEEHGVNLKLPGVVKSPEVFEGYANNLRSYGRHTCFIEHDGKAVLRSQHVFLD